MTQNEILEILSKPEIATYFDNISKVHMHTKHYLLLAEEISEQGVAFLQPLKEHRDAYDHLMRIFGLTQKNHNNTDVQANNMDMQAYILDNIKKAFGHEYRAFFDTADWFTYICRRYIRETFEYKAKRKAYSQKYDYEETKQFINTLPLTIAKYREDKDVSKNRADLEVDEVLDYKKTMDKLLEIYIRVQSL